MEAYAVVQTGGKQYRVAKGDRLKVERLPSEAGATIELQPVLAASNGTELTVGTPELPNVKVTAEVVEHTRGPKVVAYKMKRRKGYERKIGHRQNLTVLKVADIQIAN